MPFSPALAGLVFIRCLSPWPTQSKGPSIPRRPGVNHMALVRFTRISLLLLSLLAAAGPRCVFAAGTFIPPPTTVAMMRNGVALAKDCQPYYIPSDGTGTHRPGTTVLLAYVGHFGNVIRAKVLHSSGNSALDFAAMSCVKDLGPIFLPAHIGTIPIPSWQQLSIDWAEVAGAVREKPLKPFFALH